MVISENSNLKYTFVIPAKNEKGNILNIITGFDRLNLKIELIFIICKESEDTYDEIENYLKKYKLNPSLSIIYEYQIGYGKGDAVWQGFIKSSGSIVSIFDADCSVSHEDAINIANLSYDLKILVCGDRLKSYYKKTGRFFHYLFNVMISLLLKLLFNVRLRDSLCGSKSIPSFLLTDLINFKNDIKIIDKWGDLELIIGCTIIGNNVINYPVNYNDRSWGKSKISKLEDSYLIVKYCLKIFCKLYMHNLIKKIRWTLRFYKYSYLSFLFKKNNDVISYIACKYIKRGNLVLDIGANNGMSSLMFSSFVGKTGLVVGYEPNIKFHNLLDFISKNNLYKNIQFRKYGLSSQKGITNFYIDKRINSQASTINNEFYLKEKGIRGDIFEKTNSLFNILDDEDLKKISFIKIDTEGSELDILNGGKNRINKDKPLILFEFFFDDSDQTFYNKKISLFNYFEELNYSLILLKIFYINDEKFRFDLNKINSKNFIKINRNYKFDNYTGVDILAIPN